MENAPSLRIQRSSMLNTINGVGKALRFIGLDPFKFNAERIITEAKKKSGYSGSLPLAEEGLHKLVDSINHDAQTNPFGAMAVKALLERTLYYRYKIEQHLAAHPEIEQEPVKEPVFIIGLPRTGTTILHATLQEDPAHRAPLAWECLRPFPVPKPETYSHNDQLDTVRKEFDQLFKLIPDFLKKHYMAADSPQECLAINAFDFNSFQTTAQLYIPGYMEWFAHRADRLATMRFHKRYLQYLQSGGVRSERWLLKSPVHLMRLPELFEVYPDARIIMTHRASSNIVTSTASLISSVRTLYSDHEDPHRTGKEQLDTWSLYFKRFLEDRKRLQKDDRIIDLMFDDFASDQMGTIKHIYDHFGWKLTPEADDRMKHFLLSNPKGKYGLHFYSPETFGLTKEEIDARFSEYNAFLSNLKRNAANPLDKAV